MRTSYLDFPGFEFVYLEDSFVSNVQDQAELRIDLEAVILPGYVGFEPPAPNEKYTYRALQLRFEGLVTWKWRTKIMRPIRDVSGEFDFGNIDFFFRENGRFYLGGDWGELEVQAETPVLTEARTPDQTLRSRMRH